ncbi:iron complex transport system substrate-binding protein [Methylomarinovum caldicuralii]|uniref:Iron complex transport system substrate-binding protein n=1 Tax=Methylomarinovum caldicuralii TaxID=438856 RepID=A0AAU9BXL3_9GAMM|nr:GxxExxY protein [Methylomarinovum caldicuralii]BCX80747.1 iron complex transport system substrate-binding protein [Methylomarinovum caldicuralii]
MDRCPVCRAHLTDPVCPRCGSDFTTAEQACRQARALMRQAVEQLQAGEPAQARHLLQRARQLDGADELGVWLAALLERPWQYAAPADARLQALAKGMWQAACRVRHALGPGLRTPVYRAALTLELANRSLPFRADVAVEAEYGGGRFSTPYRIDWLLDGRLAVILTEADNLPQCIRDLSAIVRLVGLEAGLWLHCGGAAVALGWVLPATIPEEKHVAA